MAKKESTQHKLDRVRAPRVQLTYDVEVGDAIEKKELPFVAGVVGNFSGQPAEPLGKLKDRKFVNVDKDNYDDVLKGMKPRVQMQVENKLAGDDSKLGVELTFRSLEDFSPERVVNQIDPLRKLLEARQKLADLRKGRSRVLERDHVVILGWSQQIFAVISELLEGGAGRRRR